ncbi:MAG TPA: transcription termination/antitermination protein NusG [Acidimicrobiia bacterium]|nr:transcription termination/antitermination protein NusG [Acidimicrobiia bacterium]
MPDLETAEMETPELKDSDLEESEDAPEAETPEREDSELEDSDAPEPESPELEESETSQGSAPGRDVDITELDTVELTPVETETTEAESGGDETESPERSGEDEVAPVSAIPASPYDMPGDWYVIHSYSGYENKVKANLETRIQSMHMEDRIFEVHIPMEDVVEFKGGKKVTVPKKVFPGYILVRMTLDDDSWYAVRNTPGVTGFVAGNAQKPTPLSRREVERFLGVQEEEEKAKPRFRPEWEVGEQVRVVTGPFADFNGVIEDMNVDQQKIVVLVNIFGRDTPVELGFEDIQKS